MPRCYFLALSAGSSLDQQSNNVSLFQLVEQVNLPALPADATAARLPLEIHAYFHVAPDELGQSIEMRFALAASSGLETYTDSVAHRVATPRFRTRAMGLPMPPYLGQFELRVDFRLAGSTGWQRDPMSWPIAFLEMPTTPPVTH
ncbi:MAG TPA: hypothetical protein VLC09_13465 [Polyangiaceae bacterium]|nr:hypothetical protein [Polyangiaceae bacterium]